MKFALVNGKKTEATNGAKGICSHCKAEVIAKCGEIKIHHWAHKGNRDCDPWSEPETEWHREWKNCFDAEWQEFPCKDEITGETHRADVKTPHGWTIEIQHSPMDDEERKVRNSFYKKIAWVIDGTKRKTDIDQLNRLLTNGVPLKTKFPTVAVNPDNKNRLLTEWHNKDSLVFFDFKQIDRNSQRIIWFAIPKLKPENANIPVFTNYLFLQAFPASWFIEAHKNGAFEQFFTREIYVHILQYCKELYNIRRRYVILGNPNPNLSWLGRK